MSADRILAALRPVVALFERLGIAYQIGGSVASSTFGHARATLDVDLVADVRLEHVELIATALRGDYYADAERMRDAVRTRSCFNLLYLRAYFKVDVFVLKDTLYERAAFARRVSAVVRAGGSAQEFWFSTPEDVLLHKLAWHIAAGGSERQWQDILGLLRAQPNLDRTYLRRWAKEVGATDLLEEALRAPHSG